MRNNIISIPKKQAMKYNLPDWLQQLAKEDDLTAQCIESAGIDGASQIRMYEGLIRMNSERSRFLIESLMKYQALYGELPEEPKTPHSVE